MIWVTLFYALMSAAHVVIGLMVLRRYHINQPWIVQGLAALVCGIIWPVMSLVALKAAYDVVRE